MLYPLLMRYCKTGNSNTDKPTVGTIEIFTFFFCDTMLPFLCNRIKMVTQCLAVLHNTLSFKQIHTEQPSVVKCGCLLNVDYGVAMTTCLLCIMKLDQ